jgi:hypothetical protein
MASRRVSAGALGQQLNSTESHQFRDLRRAVANANGDREAAIRNVCRQYTVRSLDALPSAVKFAALALLDAIHAQGPAKEIRHGVRWSD